MPTYPIRRRPREWKTCLPCRNSKVRCDRGFPCGNCAKRRFACTYGRPPRVQNPIPTPATHPPSPDAARLAPRGRDNEYVASGAAPSGSALSNTVTVSQNEWDEINSKMSAMEQILSSLDSLFKSHATRETEYARPEQPAAERDPSPQSEGIYGSNALRTGAVHVGSRSAFVDILDRSKGSEDTAQALPKDDLLAELALGNESAAYPFVDLWSSDPFTFNITAVCAVLPDDEQCRTYVHP